LKMLRKTVAQWSAREEKLTVNVRDRRRHHES
jgi:hypothetical protein